jgi:hypothetical protein
MRPATPSSTLTSAWSHPKPLIRIYEILHTSGLISSQFENS